MGGGEIGIDRDRARQRLDRIGRTILGQKQRAEIVPRRSGIRRRAQHASEHRFGLRSSTHPRVGLAERVGGLQIRLVVSHQGFEHRCRSPEIAGVAQHRAERSQERPVGVAAARRFVEHGDRLADPPGRAQHEGEPIVRDGQVRPFAHDRLKRFNRASGVAPRPHRDGIVERRIQMDQPLRIVVRRVGPLRRDRGDDVAERAKASLGVGVNRGGCRQASALFVMPIEARLQVARAVAL